MSRSSVVFAVGIILQIAGFRDVAGEVDPCTDFISYACKVRNSLEATYITGRIKRMRLGKFIENYPLKVAQLSDVEKKFYNFRKYCSNATLKDKKNFLRAFNPSVGGWPAFDKNWKPDKFDLQAALADLHSSFFPTIFMIKLQNDPTSFKNQIQVNLQLSDYLYLDNFRQFMKEKLLEIIDNVDEVIRDSLVVEALYTTEENVPGVDEDVLTDYKGLKQEIPEIDWDKQLDTIYGQKVPDSFPVKINQLGLMKRIIPKIFEVEPKVMANYLLYRLGHMLPDLDEEMSSELFQNVIYQMIIKQNYAGETKEEVRGMLISFLTTLANTVNLFSDEDKLNVEKRINQFVMNEIVPDIDDSYYENFYKDVTVTPGDCYSTATQLINKHVKMESKIYFCREIDPLYEIKSELISTISLKLPNFLDAPTAIQFEALTWDILENDFLILWKPDSSKSTRQCLEKQIGQDFAQHEMAEVLQFQIFIKAYFDWAKDRTDLMQVEETKYGDSNKKILLERLIARYCEESSQTKSTLSGVFANFKEVSDVYNCPVGSPFNPQSKCEIE